MPDILQNSFKQLIQYCEREEFKGYDPYDGLTSRLFQSLPMISKSRLFRLIWIQLNKKLPINVRPLIGVRKSYNPKGLGLFLSAYSNLYHLSQQKEYKDKIYFFFNKILELKNTAYSGACWGYNFDWQSRAFFQPAGTPNVVVTTFIANALLDAYAVTGDQQFLENAISACDFVLKDLNRTYDDNGNFCFSYSVLDKSIVYNASLLGSRLLARVYSLTGKDALIAEAKKSVSFCCDRQRGDGSWGYGEASFHQWVDNFHTGFNLECIAEYMKFSYDSSYQEQLDKGFSYYVDTFFTSEGTPRYYNNETYPIDVHATAQLIVTLCRMNKFQDYRELAEKVLGWTILNMQSEKGFFYFQRRKFISSKIPYMRWSQAWMFYAFSLYFLNLDKTKTTEESLYHAI
jgi:rhamnogalacturonyl hydrolase YesR